jgi:hypothetical protein
LSPTGLAFSFKDAQDSLRLRLDGANPRPRIAGTDQLPGYANYFIGNDPRASQTNVPTYARIQYRDVYPGVDLVFYGTPSSLEHDFVVGPGASSTPIALDVSGAQDARIADNGDLTLLMSNGEAIQHRLTIYQIVDGARRTIAGNYVWLSPSRVGFNVGAYDPSKPLIIDPSLTYSTYLGGSGEDQAYGTQSIVPVTPTLPATPSQPTFRRPPHFRAVWPARAARLSPS